MDLFSTFFYFFLQFLPSKASVASKVNIDGLLDSSDSKDGIFYIKFYYGGFMNGKNGIEIPYCAL